MKIFRPNSLKTSFGNFEYSNIWQPEPFAKQIRPSIPPHLYTFIERAEPLLDNYWLACVGALLGRDSMKADSDIERCRLMYRAAILERIIKKRWNSSFNANLKLPKKHIGIFKPEAELWNSAIDLMLELSLISPLKSPHPSIWFTLCLLEGTLGAFNPDSDKKTDYRKILQNGNRDLKALSNPFDRNKSPYTWWLIESAQKIAEHNDQFRKLKYTPLRQAREKLVSYLIYSPAQIISEIPAKTPSKKQRPLKPPQSNGFQT